MGSICTKRRDVKVEALVAPINDEDAEKHFRVMVQALRDAGLIFDNTDVQDIQDYARAKHKDSLRTL